MKTLKYILAVAASLAVLPLSAKDYYASTFGIKSNGTTMNTTSIQKAIDFISEEGGGKLIFKVGRYLTGTIELKDNVTIELSEGAVLVGSTNPYDYRQARSEMGLIIAYQAKNCGIIGRGVIDGQGRELANNFLGQIANGIIKDPLGLGRPARRAHLLYLREVKGLTIKDVNIRNSSCWTVYLDQCEDTMVDGISLTSRAFWNNDGVDIVDCKNFTIQNCFIDSSDDGICLKSHDSKSCCDNILVQNNVVTSSASGIKFGTFGKGGFKNVTLLNNTIYDTFRSALTIQAVDGGMAENIVCDGLKSLNTANPIYIVVGERHGVGSYAKNITIKNVYAELSTTKPDYGLDYEGPTLEDEPRNVCPCAIVGLPGNNVTDVTIENVEIKFPGGADPNYACVKTTELNKVPEMPKAYPEFSQFKELPAWGFFIRHAENVVFKNVSLSAAAKDYRPCVVCDDVKNADFSGLKATAPALKAKVYANKKSTGIKK